MIFITKCHARSEKQRKPSAEQKLAFSYAEVHPVLHEVKFREKDTHQRCYDILRHVKVKVSVKVYLGFSSMWFC